MLTDKRSSRPNDISFFETPSLYYGAVIDDVIARKPDSMSSHRIKVKNQKIRTRIEVIVEVWIIRHQKIWIRISPTQGEIRELWVWNHPDDMGSASFITSYMLRTFWDSLIELQEKTTHDDPNGMSKKKTLKIIDVLPPITSETSSRPIIFHNNWYLHLVV